MRCDLDQLFGHNPDASLDTRHAGLPCRAAKTIELRIGAGTAVTRQHLDIFNRQIQPVAASIDQLQAVMLTARRIDDDQPLIPPDTMFGVDDQIAIFQRTDFAQKILTAPAFGAGTRQSLTKDLGLGNDQKPVTLKPGIKPPFDKIQAATLQPLQACDPLNQDRSKLRLQQFLKAGSCALTRNSQHNRAIGSSVFI